MRFRSLPSCTVLAVLLLGVIAPGAAATGDGGGGTGNGTFSCTASALRVTLLGGTIEPIVANPQDAPCADDSTGLVGPIVFAPVTINGVATARTDATPSGGRAESTVTKAVIAVGPGIRADVLTSRTNVTCTNGQPSFSSSGNVVFVRIGATVVQIPANQGPVVVNIPLVGTLYLNEVVTTPTSITRRALRLDTALVDVVIAESTSNVEGNPCGATPPPPAPQCSDGLDNDGDKLTDAADPGCQSGAGGSYDPTDDDETNAPPPPPQCSDGQDNDGDKAMDRADPQCHSDGDPKNDESYDPNDNDESK